MLIVDGTLVPTRDHTVAEQAKNNWYSTNHQVVIDADTRLVALIGRPLPGNRNDCRAWSESGVKDAVGTTTTIADGDCRGPGWSSRTVAARARNFRPTAVRMTRPRPGAADGDSPCAWKPIGLR